MWSSEPRPAVWALGLGALLGAAACGDAGQGQPPVTRQVTVWNRCTTSAEEPNFYALEALYTHFSESWQGAANKLSAPLAVGAELIVAMDNGTHVTVVRKRNLGQRIALTTSTPLDLSEPCNLLEVFDDAFRLTRDDSRCFDTADDGPPGGDPTPGD